MLGAADFNNIRGSFESTIHLLGVPATWVKAIGGQTATVQVGFKTAGVKDTEIINAYGLNAIVMTVRQIDLPVAPEKFDSFTVQGVRHTADAVHPVHLNGSIIGWKIYVRGSN